MKLALVDQAIRLASHGLLVIPVEGKRPMLENWQSKATSDAGTVARLFAAPHDGVGVQLGQRSNLIDFDCDSAQAEETIQRLFGNEIPKTPTFKSSRGLHRLFKWTDKLPQGSIKLVVDGLEIRLGNGDKGCQTVFPPSSGREWITDIDDCELAEIPQTVIDRINARYAEIHKPKAMTRQTGFTVESPSGDDMLNVPKWLSKHGRDIIGRTDGSDGVTRWHIECPGMDRHTTPSSFRDCCITQDGSGKLGGSCFHSSCGMSSWHELKSAIGEPVWADYHEELINAPAFDPIPDYVEPVEEQPKPRPEPVTVELPLPATRKKKETV